MTRTTAITESVPFLIIFLALLRTTVLGGEHEDFYSFSVTTANGETLALEKFRGKVTLVVNVASECGYTDSHYRDLVELYEKFRSTGAFEILAFPCNQFGAQEPKKNMQIFQHVRSTYNVQFPVLAKVNVLEPNVEPAFQNLVDQSGKAPNWNFWKYLVDENGRVIDAWGQRTSVASIRNLIETAVEKTQKVQRREL